MMAETQKQVTEDAVVLTHVFDAPREQVWEAWTDPEWVKRWGGPHGFSAPVYELDMRPGGWAVSCMKPDDGECFWGVGTFREVTPPERFVVTVSFADEQGNVVPATEYGMSEKRPREMLIEETFEEMDGKTRVTVRHSPLTGVAKEDREGMAQGWSEQFEKLDALL